MIMPDDSFALRDEAERARRGAMLFEPHMRPLTVYSDRVRKSIGLSDDIPMFDPCDGGVDARVLIFLEAPGRKAVTSQFVSRNNPDRTAAKINQLLSIAGINRKDTILWNIVPWYIGKDNTRKKIRAANVTDIEKSLPFIKEFITLLPNLDIIVLMGNKAQLAKAEILKMTKAVILFSAHPSPQVVNRYPEKIEKAQAMFNDVAYMLKILAPNNAPTLSLTLKNIDDLLAFLPIFKNPEFRAFSFETDAYNVARLKYDPSIKTFCDFISQPSWYYDYDPVDADVILRNDKLLEKASINDIKAALTYFVCGERFSDGFQGQLVKDGHISKLLERLNVLKPMLVNL
jgi:uracil-DNA glycosylase